MIEEGTTAYNAWVETPIYTKFYFFAIKQKLLALEKKIIVGGENLLDKAEEQEKLLDESAKELEETIETEQKLRQQLKAKEAERVDIEEKYSSLQEEASGKPENSRKFGPCFSQLKVN